MYSIQVGDYIVYPSQGVAQIIDQATFDVSGEELECFLLKVKDSSNHIMVPVDRVTQCGLRPVISRQSTEEVLQTLSRHNPPPRRTSWIQRFRTYREHLNSGVLNNVAKVFRDLYQMKQEGPLSFGQMRLLERSQQMLIEELSIALEQDQVQIDHMICAHARQCAG